MVDVVNQITRAYTYDENGEYTILVREMICSTGTEDYPTPLGTTIMPKKRARWGYFPQWDSHAQYLTRIDSANAFHSVLYSEADERTLSTKSFEALGTPASMAVCGSMYPTPSGFMTTARKELLSPFTKANTTPNTP